MATYRIEEESLVAIADEVRALAGSSGLMGTNDMAAYLGEANEDVAEQAELLAQIASALEGKGASGSEDLNAILEEQEALINELQSTLEGKAAAGGGGSIETWTGTVYADPIDLVPCAYTYVETEELIEKEETIEEPEMEE